MKEQVLELLRVALEGSDYNVDVVHSDLILVAKFTLGGEMMCIMSFEGPPEETFLSFFRYLILVGITNVKTPAMPKVDAGFVSDIKLFGEATPNGPAFKVVTSEEVIPGLYENEQVGRFAYEVLGVDGMKVLAGSVDEGHVIFLQQVIDCKNERNSNKNRKQSVPATKSKAKSASKKTATKPAAKAAGKTAAKRSGKGSKGTGGK